MSNRLTIHNPSVIRHVIDHPARGFAWSVRELAETIGANRSTIGHLRTGKRLTVDAVLGAKLAEAVGVHPNILFVSASSTNPHTGGHVS